MLCLVARELCLFLAVNAGKVPPKQRRGFVEMAVRRAAPYQDPELDLTWHGDHPAVWYWSRSRILERLSEVRFRRISFVAEALYAGTDRDDAQELLALGAGFEGRLWRQSRLVSSRWWASLPDARQWHDFVRAAGIAAPMDAAPPDAIPAPLSRDRWTSAPAGHAATLAGLESVLPRALPAVAGLVVLLLAWQLGSALRAGIDQSRAHSASLDLDEPLRRILDARAEADAARANIEQLLALRDAQPQYRLLAEAARLMQGRQWQVRVWQQPTPQQLEITMLIPAADLEQLVSAWEASPLFEDVTGEITLRQDEVILRATVVTPGALRP